jgi:hypothetical protein
VYNGIRDVRRIAGESRNEVMSTCEEAEFAVSNIVTWILCTPGYT